MAIWTDLIFAFKEILTSAKMQQLDDNITALSEGASGAPVVQAEAINYDRDTMFSSSGVLSVLFSSAVGVVLGGQTINDQVSVTDPVYYEPISAEWRQARGGTRTPIGIYIDNDKIALNGYFSGLPGLVANTHYWLDNAGGLVDNSIDSATKCHILYAITATEVIVNIAVEGIGTSRNARIYLYFGGGYSGGNSDVIEYITADTATQNATDTGDLTVARNGLATVSGGVFLYFGGGGSNGNVIDYITADTATQNATDTGDLIAGRDELTGVSGTILLYFGGGRTPGLSNIIDYIVANTATQNATDTGDLTSSRYSLYSVSGSVLLYFGGGFSTFLTNIIDYITANTATQNAADTGDLISSKQSGAGVSGTTLLYFGGGRDSGGETNVIEYITADTATQNATDTGDMTVAKEFLAGASGETLLYFGGGRTTVTIDIIDYITADTATQNATDTGDLIAVKQELAGV